MSKLLMGLLLAAGFITARKVVTATKLKFYPKGVKLTGSGLTEQKLWLIAEVVNPTFTQLTINNMFFTVQSGDKILGRIEYNTPLVIGKNGTTVVNIPIKLNLGGLAWLTTEYLLKGTKPEFKIVGSLNSGGASIPIETNLSLL